MSTPAGASAYPQVAVLLAQLEAAGESVAAAESLTGGLVTAALIAVPGASNAVAGSVVAYGVAAKRDVLGVDPELLAEHGTVSAACAEAMAVRARELFAADWGMATTGVAGPDESEGHPAGMVFVAVAGEQVRRSRLLSLSGTRDEVRVATVEAALEALAGELNARDVSQGG